MGKKTKEPVIVDLNDQNMMDWINEMRNSRPSAKERRKISDYQYYHRHKEERAEANRKWREEHAEQYTEKQKEYHSKPKTLKRNAKPPEPDTTPTRNGERKCLPNKKHDTMR